MKQLTAVALLCALVACSKKADSGAPSNTMIDAATHSARYFPIGPGDVHGPPAGQQQVTTCNGCHADRTAPAQTTGCSTPAPCYPPSASFKTFTCTGCHVEVQPGVFHDDIAGLAALPAHAGQAGFDPAQPLAFDQACLGCHRDGAGGTPPVYHADLFPIDAASKHAGIGCSSCHGSSRADLTQLKCASCHAPDLSAQHAPIPTPIGTIAILVVLTPPPPASCAPSPLPPLQSPDCLMCHARSNVDHVELPPTQGGHPTGSSAFGTDRHVGAGCFTCHLATTQVTATVTPPTPAPSGYPTVDFSQPSNPSRTSTPGCTTCHSSGCGGGG